jgi:hypothetical protein
VDANGNEIARDELRDALIRIHLGIQPSTATSHRRGAEVEENRLLPRLRFAEDLVEIVTPGDGHRVLP